MQNILLQRSIVPTILYVTLFYAVATGCNRTGSKQTNITVITKPTEIPEEERKDPKDTDPNDFLDTPGENKNDKDDEDIKKKIEEALAIEQQRLEEAEKEEEEKDPKDTDPNDFLDTPGENKNDKDDEDIKKKIEEAWATEQQRRNHGYSSKTPPFPKLPDDPPPPYTSYQQGNNLSTSFSYNHPIPTSSNPRRDSNQDHNYTFDKDDLEDLRKNASTKRKVIRYYLNTIYKLREEVSLWFKKGYMYMCKEKLKKLEGKKTELEQTEKGISRDPALSTKDRAKELESLFLKIDIINYRIEWLKQIIEMIKKKNNKSDESTNARTKPYPVQQ